MEAPLTVEQLAEFIMANYTLSIWSSRYGLSPVSMNAAALVAAAKAAHPAPAAPPDPVCDEWGRYYDAPPSHALHEKE